MLEGPLAAMTTYETDYLQGAVVFVIGAEGSAA